MFNILMLSIALATAAPVQDKPRNPTCRALLYASGLVRDFWPMRPAAEQLRRWRDRSQAYVKAGGHPAIVSWLYGRSAANVFERELHHRRLLKGVVESPIEPGVGLLEIDREGLLGEYPELSSWLPPDYHLVIDPELEVSSDTQAALNRGEENVIVLPLNLVTGDLTEVDRTALRAVAGHVQRRRDRMNGDYTLSLIFETEYDVPALGARPAKAHVEAESILTGTLNTVFHLKRFCENPGDPEASADAEHHLNLTWREIEAYRQLVLPRLGRVLKEAESLMFDNEGHWIVGSLTVTFQHPRPVWDLKAARRWFRAEKARFERIDAVFSGLHARFARETAHGKLLIPNAATCTEVGQLTALLGTLAPLAR